MAWIPPGGHPVAIWPSIWGGGGGGDGLAWIHRGHRSVVLSCSDIMTMGHFESLRNTS